MSAAPSIRHQRVSKRLQRELLRLFEDPGHGEVLQAPVGPVRLRGTVLGEIDLAEVFARER